MMPTCDIRVGDALEVLRTMPSESVQCCVTSPPYWGLRDYGVKGQMGLEPTPEAFVAGMVAVFEEVRRVLKRDGTCWVNMGDSYASTGGHSDTHCNDRRGARNIANRPEHSFRELRVGAGGGLKSKDLVGMPWRLAFGLQSAGWFLRCDIIWHKPNPMPESVKDRPTKAHEYIFLLSKNERYYYDQAAIREACSTNSHPRRSQKTPAGWAAGVEDHSVISWATAENQGRSRLPGSYNGSDFRKGKKGAIHKNVGQGDRSAKKMMALDNSGEHHGQNARRSQEGSFCNDKARRTRKLAPANSGIRNNESFEEAMAGMVEVRNKRSVWSVPTAPYREAHFATFPPDLIKPCILAGTRAGDVVLDPFGGSGTTGQVALELGRSAIMIELNPKYVEMARRRLQVTPGLGL